LIERGLCHGHVLFVGRLSRLSGGRWLVDHPTRCDPSSQAGRIGGGRGLRPGAL